MRPRGPGAPLVTVLVPCHNYARYVGEAIESILEQSLPAREREIIVVDDASSDESWSVIQSYEGHGVIGVRHVENSGHIRTYHDAMSRARGAYIVLLSADDKAIDRDALRDQSDLLGQDPRVGLAYSDFAVIDADGRRLATKRLRTPTLLAGAVAFHRLLFENFIQHSGTMVRREWFEQTGGYDERLFHSVDWELWLRIAAKADLGHIRRPLYAYRVHTRNMHHTHGYIDSMDEIRRVFDIAAQYGPRPALESMPRALARHHVRRSAAYIRRHELRESLRDLIAAARLDARAIIDLELVKAVLIGAPSWWRGGRRP